MLLIIKSSTAVKIIKLDASFFSNTKVYKGKKEVEVTPESKALDIAKDNFGDHFTEIKLFKNQEILYGQTNIENKSTGDNPRYKGKNFHSNPSYKKRSKSEDDSKTRSNKLPQGWQTLIRSIKTGDDKSLRDEVEELQDSELTVA